ncbi:hypothetical protein DFH09DRAFT_336553 [Mycena vulgaris]|nr:hypothetical protein DFH09DRAFT_336553 [Mycena vulgaris]
MPDLPRELVEAIVDAVEDPECLKLCSLASSQFLAPCQRILCPTISISQNCGVNLSIHQVFETITESPHLALYIRELTVFLLHLEDDHTPLLGIIQAVTNAECLIIRGSPHSGTFISSDLIPSILNVLTRPVFRRLHLMHLYHVQPSFMLRALSSTRAVLLRGVGVDVNPADTEYTDEPSGYPPSRLEDLTILARVRRPNDMVNIFDLITGDKMLRHLQRLQRLVLEVNLGANQARCARIFAAVSETLQHLDIHCGDNGTYAFIPPELPQSPTCP